MYLTTAQRELVCWLRDARIDEPTAAEIEGEVYEDQSHLVITESRIARECDRLGLHSRETMDILSAAGLLEVVPAESHGTRQRIYFVTALATLVANESEAASAVAQTRKPKGKPGRKPKIDRNIDLYRDWEKQKQDDAGLTLEQFAFANNFNTRSAVSHALAQAKDELRRRGEAVN